MAAYAQYSGCGYPSANQYLPGGALATLAAASSTSTHHHPLSQSPVAPTTPTHAPSLSPPSNGHDSNVSSVGVAGGAGGDAHSGALTPDPASQTSNATSNVGASGSASAGSTDSVGSGSLAAGLAYGLPPPPTLVGVAPPPPPPLSAATACCDNGRPVMTDPMTGQTVCSCQYDPAARLALSSYARMQSGAAAPPPPVGVYGTPYPSNEQNPYPSISVDSGPFYSSLSTPYALKDSSCNGSEVTTWSPATSLSASTGYYTYDPTFGAYGYGASYDLASRRKNATRESTATLKAWLNEHKKNPYPTKGEKIMLAIITKMTLTQVSTWFANARRRLKKENKMTWEPKNRTEDDEEDALASDEEKTREEADNGAVACAGAAAAAASTTTAAANVALERRSRHPSDYAANNGALAGVTSTTTATAAVEAAATDGGSAPHSVAGVGVGVGIVSMQPPKEALELTTLNNKTLHYDVYERTKYTHPATFNASSGYVYARADEPPYTTQQNSAGNRIWSLASAAAIANNDADAPPHPLYQRDWPSHATTPTMTNYAAQPYATSAAALKPATAVVATISMQPSSPTALPNGLQHYNGGGQTVTPPQTPPNQLQTSYDGAVYVPQSSTVALCGIVEGGRCCKRQDCA